MRRFLSFFASTLLTPSLRVVGSLPWLNNVDDCLLELNLDPAVVGTIKEFFFQTDNVFYVASLGTVALASRVLLVNWSACRTGESLLISLRCTARAIPRVHVYCWPWLVPSIIFFEVTLTV